MDGVTTKAQRRACPVHAVHFIDPLVVADLREALPDAEAAAGGDLGSSIGRGARQAWLGFAGAGLGISATRGTARTLAEPVSRRRPGRRSRSTDSFLAGTRCGARTNTVVGAVKGAASASRATAGMVCHASARRGLVLWCTLTLSLCRSPARALSRSVCRACALARVRARTHTPTMGAIGAGLHQT